MPQARRAPRVLTTLLSVCALLLSGMVMTPVASSDPTMPLQPPGTNPCGYDTDSDSLWQQVRGLTTKNPGNPNLIAQVVDPPGHNYGFAVHYGQNKATSEYDYLVVPTKRQSGIECPEIYQPWAINLFAYSLQQAEQRLAGQDIALGINSEFQRGKNQLHIHVTRLVGNARTDINNQIQQIPVEHNKWKDNRIKVAGHTFRALWVLSPWDRNLFEVLHNQIAPGGPQDMGKQILLVTPAPHHGYVVLNSQADLDNNTGLGNVESLLHKNP